MINAIAAVVTGAIAGGYLSHTGDLKTSALIVGVGLFNFVAGLLDRK